MLEIRKFFIQVQLLAGELLILYIQILYASVADRKKGPVPRLPPMCEKNVFLSFMPQNVFNADKNGTDNVLDI